MTTANEIRKDSTARTDRFAALETAFHDAGIKKRAAIFAAMTLAAVGPDSASGTLPRQVAEMAAALKSNPETRKLTADQTRPAIAAALLATGKDEKALEAARHALPRQHFGALSGLRPQAAIMLAVSDTKASDALWTRHQAIIDAAPHRWYGARAIGPVPALSLALQGVTPETALARFEAARSGLEAAGLWGPTATGYAPKLAALDPNAPVLANNFKSLKEGRKTDKRLKLLNDERRALLAAAAPDPDALHAALEPPLDAAFKRKRKLSTSAGALAACLALAALGKASPDQSVRELLAIIAAEQAAVIAATTAATTAAVSTSG